MFLKNSGLNTPVCYRLRLTGMKSRRHAIIILIFSAIVGIFIYWRFNPVESVWMPQCWFYRLTGWECPSCGSQRALHALLHGKFNEAWKFNRFLVISTPYLLAVAWSTLVKDTVSRTCREIVQHPTVMKIYFVLIILWWIVRNIWTLN